MKTFEEQFTAWVDDRLPADEHAAFERALAARPDADALRAERRMALRLRDLLRESLHAPALSNPDFFNHGIMERIAAEEARAGAVAAPRRRAAAWWQWDWTPARLLAAGAACLLTALVGVRALIPTGTEKTPAAVAQNDPNPSLPAPAAVTVAPMPAPVSVPPGAGSRNDGQEAKLNVQPPPVPVVDPSPAPPVYRYAAALRRRRRRRDLARRCRLPAQPGRCRHRIAVPCPRRRPAMRNGMRRPWPWWLPLAVAVPWTLFGGGAPRAGAQPPPSPSSEPTQNVAAHAPEPAAGAPARATPTPAVDVLYGALILATRSDDPRPAELPAPLRPLAKQLGVFGYNQFQVLGEKRAAVPTGTEDWLVPSRQFFLRVDTRNRLPEGDGYQLDLQLFQHDRPLTTVDCRLRRERPLFIRGPLVGAGQLIILLRML